MAKRKKKPNPLRELVDDVVKCEPQTSGAFVAAIGGAFHQRRLSNSPVGDITATAISQKCRFRKEAKKQKVARIKHFNKQHYSLDFPTA